MRIDVLKHPLRLMLICVSLMGAGCGEGKRPYAMVHMCVVNDDGVSTFKHVMREIAASEGMEFVDGSARTDKELKIINPDGKYNFINGGIINVGMQGNGISLSATNLGLLKYQIAIGFSGDAEREQTAEFVQRVVGPLSRHWVVEFVPSDQGVFKMDECGE
ncbi:hypothetical protein [Zavarzinia compransoris]|uniref:Uncharacterized protein n=1 Tax=Zavarzinia compransoris TaxID=1264899 RepID=A0A317E9R0_9PROT|nr:hypothetical protein [Zavarzinia compransoris]PWR22053.1 hypothetical protein DKG75_08730 [Zavarzinia compransoris]